MVRVGRVHVEETPKRLPVPYEVCPQSYFETIQSKNSPLGRARARDA